MFLYLWNFETWSSSCRKTKLVNCRWMFAHVLFKITGMSICVSAFGALIRFFSSSSVNAEVGFQSACFAERAPALLTMIWLLSFFAAGCHVHLQSICSTKWALTFWASVCLFSIMGEHVLFKTCTLTKLFLALDKSEGSFFAMGYHLPLQMSCFVTWIWASWTNMHPEFIGTKPTARHFDFVWHKLGTPF